jgi:NAD dependent epimerase/dehydratase
LRTKVLVTGAAGFIGSHLVETLVAAGHEVRAFVHYNSSSYRHNLEQVPADVMEHVEVVSGDIADAFAVDRAVQGCDSVCHLAALIGIPYSYVAPGAYVSTNITGTLNVLEACRRSGVRRLVHISSSEVYGTAQYVPIDEAHPLVGQSPYSATKIGADQLADSYWRTFELPVVTIRPFNTFGPRQSARAVVPTIISQALTQDVVKLGNLDPVRELNFVLDTARGMMTALEADANKVLGQVINLGCGEGRSVREVVNTVGEILGRELVVESEPTRMRPDKSEVMRLESNPEKAARLMGWKSQYSFVDGLRLTVEYVRDNLGRYKSGYAV